MQGCKRHRKKGFVIIMTRSMSLNYKCKNKQNFLLDSHERERKVTFEAENGIKEDNLTVSINAIFGSTSHQTMRICGNIKKKHVTMLIDLGSTHNFLDPIVAKEQDAQYKLPTS